LECQITQELYCWILICSFFSSFSKNNRFENENGPCITNSHKTLPFTPPLQTLFNHVQSFCTCIRPIWWYIRVSNRYIQIIYNRLGTDARMDINYRANAVDRSGPGHRNAAFGGEAAAAAARHCATPQPPRLKGTAARIKWAFLTQRRRRRVATREGTERERDRQASWEF